MRDITSSVKDYYNTYNYPLINLYTNRQRKHNLKLLSSILGFGSIKLSQVSGLKVLDAGCGTGEKSILLAKYGSIVTGMDLSTNQLNHARRIAREQKVNINFIEKDLVSDSLTNLGKFDVIICTGVLHHTKNPVLAFNKLSNQLKEDGVIVLGLYHKYSRLRYRFIRFLIRLFISRSYNSKKIIKWLDSNNFFAKQITKAPRNSIYDRYVVPHESYHTLREVNNWFKKNNLKTIGYSENVKGVGITKIFEKKSLFFVAGKKI